MKIKKFNEFNEISIDTDPIDNLVFYDNANDYLEQILNSCEHQKFVDALTGDHENYFRQGSEFLFKVNSWGQVEVDISIWTFLEEEFDLTMTEIQKVIKKIFKQKYNININGFSIRYE